MERDSACVDNIVSMKSDSTVTSLEENTNITSDVLASGIIQLFKPAIDQLDERVFTTKLAQGELKFHLNQLTSQLKEIETAQCAIPELSIKIKELISMNHKVIIITNILNNCQERLNSLQNLICGEEGLRKSVLQS